MQVFNAVYWVVKCVPHLLTLGLLFYFLFNDIDLIYLNRVVFGFSPV